MSSARDRPIPPAPPKPLSERPAAMYKPVTPGTGPARGFESGVIASGWQTSFTIPASCRNGKRRAAPVRSGSKLAPSGGREGGGGGPRPPPAPRPPPVAPLPPPREPPPPPPPPRQ